MQPGARHAAGAGHTARCWAYSQVLGIQPGAGHAARCWACSQMLGIQPDAVTHVYFIEFLEKTKVSYHKYNSA